MRSWVAPVGLVVVTGALVVWAMSTFSASDRPPRPVVVATGEWPPFVGGDLPELGPAATLVREAMQRAGFDPQLQLESWDEAQNRAAAGDVVGAFPFIKTDVRLERFLFSDPLFSFRYVLFYKRPEHRGDGRDLGLMTGPEELGELEIGIVRGYEAWGAVADAITEDSLYDSLIGAFEALDRGEIDLLVESLVVGNRVLMSPDARLDASHFAALEGSSGWLEGSRQDLYLVAPRTREGERFLAAFDRGLAELRESASFEEILRELDPRSSSGPARIVLHHPPIVAFEPSGVRRYLLPAGTRAAVLQWPEEFVDGRTVRDGRSTDLRLEVKVLNGPLKGRILTVAVEKAAVEEPADLPALRAFQEGRP